MPSVNMRPCSVKGCDAKIKKKNKTGRCVLHLHTAGCPCRGCAAKAAARNLPPPPKPVIPYVSLNPPREEVSFVAGGSLTVSHGSDPEAARRLAKHMIAGREVASWRSVP